MAAGSIPHDILDLMALTCERHSHEGMAFSRVLSAYEARVGHTDEPIYRKRLAELYCQQVPAKKERVLTPPQRKALERCAQGEAYTMEG